MPNEQIALIKALYGCLWISTFWCDLPKATLVGALLPNHSLLKSQSKTRKSSVVNLSLFFSAIIKLLLYADSYRYKMSTAEFTNPRARRQNALLRAQTPILNAVLFNSSPLIFPVNSPSTSFTYRPIVDYKERGEFSYLVRKWKL